MNTKVVSPHTRLDDVQAILTGTLVVALGIAMFKKAGLLTGGVTGLAFLSHYGTGINFGLLLVLLNLPFYLMAWQRMGRAFTLKSLASVSLVAVFTESLPHLIRFEWVHPAFAAITGGLLIGVGMLILFRHQASLGGLNVLVLWLQETRGWRAGAVQMVFDSVIVLASAWVVPLELILISILGAVTLNLTLTINHKPGRYITA